MRTNEYLFKIHNFGLLEVLNLVYRSSKGKYREIYDETIGSDSSDGLTDFIRSRALMWRVIPSPRQVVTVQSTYSNQHWGLPCDNQLQIVYGPQNTLIVARSNKSGRLITGFDTPNIAYDIMKQLKLHLGQSLPRQFNGF